VPSFSAQLPNIIQVGPISEVLIAPPQALVQVLRANGQPVPQPVRAVAMVDTGASGTVLTPSVVAQLGLQPVGVSQMSTPSTTAPVQTRLFNVDITFALNNVSVTGVVATEAPLGGQHIQCLIGRDILQHGVLVYIGYLNQFTLSF
jgi:predicted aspartyl protease